jgi:hypothetical protein
MSALLSSFVTIPAAAAADKRGYNFSNPVPTELMREMTTDRPDATESPFTIDPGHVQIEMDFANYGREREAGIEASEWEAVPFNLRFGLTENFEAGVFIVPYRSVTVKSAGVRVRSTGFGDVVLRGKWNFFGNDEGATALGLMADLKVPTGDDGFSNDEWEGAITLPVAFEIGGGWSGAAMTAVEILYVDAGHHRGIWSNTITAGRDLTETIGGFVELTSSVGDGSHVATFNCGLTHALSPDLQLDAGLNFGLTSAATDLVVFAGMARRF